MECLISQTEEFHESTDFIPESPILVPRVRCSQYVLFPLSPRTTGLSDIHAGLSDSTNRHSFNVYLNTPSCMFNIMSCVHKYLIHGHIYRHVISERRPAMFQAMGSLLFQQAGTPLLSTLLWILIEFHYELCITCSLG